VRGVVRSKRGVVGRPQMSISCMRCNAVGYRSYFEMGQVPVHILLLRPDLAHLMLHAHDTTLTHTRSPPRYDCAVTSYRRQRKWRRSSHMSLFMHTMYAS
jgi:hypothetical protein